MSASETARVLVGGDVSTCGRSDAVTAEDLVRRGGTTRIDLRTASPAVGASQVFPGPPAVQASQMLPGPTVHPTVQEVDEVYEVLSVGARCDSFAQGG